MLKKAKLQIKSKRAQIDMINPDAAGIDISSTEHQVCVPQDRCKDYNRCFGCYTSDLHSIAKWLKECNIKTVAMESTGIYWVQLFLVLEEYGFEVLLVNARHIKNIGGKKTDVSDAEWIMTLHSYGLLRASYQPDIETREVREYMRQRETLIQSASREVLHMQKSCEQMNIKLHKVISDILGKSGMSIIEAILKGIRDPTELAQLADPRVKATKEEIIKSLEANWSNSQLFILKQSYELYLFYKSRIEQCDLQIQEYLEALQINAQKKVVTVSTTQGEKKKRKAKKLRKNDLTFDANKYLIEVLGVDLTKIPGLDCLSVTKLLSELGPRFYEKFESAKQFCSWANIVPNTKISGGRQISSKVPRKKSKVGQVFRFAAYTLSNAKSPLGEYFRKIYARRCYGQAIVAVANKIARIFYKMVKENKEYNEELLRVNDKKNLERQIAYAKRKIQILENQLAA